MKSDSQKTAETECFRLWARVRVISARIKAAVSYLGVFKRRFAPAILSKIYTPTVFRLLCYIPLWGREDAERISQRCDA